MLMVAFVVKIFGVCLGLVVLVSPAAIAAEWVVVAEDTQKQVLVDSESVQTLANGTALFNQRVRAKAKAPALTLKGTTRIDSRIEAQCYTKLYRVLSHTAYARNGKVIERSRVPSGSQVAAYGSPDERAIAAVCEN